MTEPEQQAAAKRIQGALRAKGDHQRSAQCEWPHTCGGCHFWSGYIGALLDIINEGPPPVNNARETNVLL